VRTSPALALAARLLEAGALVVGYDPEAGALAKEELPRLETAGSALEAATGAHCVVLATEWEEFRRLDLDALRAVMAHPVVVDGRNLFDPETMREAGFWYYPTGRPAVVHAPAMSVAMNPNDADRTVAGPAAAQRRTER
jgi:UDPglucose 6-dehydrogenase